MACFTITYVIVSYQLAYRLSNFGRLPLVRLSVGTLVFEVSMGMVMGVSFTDENWFVFQTHCDDTLLNDILTLYQKITAANLIFLSIDELLVLNLARYPQLS